MGSASPPRMPPSDRGPRGSRADRLVPHPAPSEAPPAKTRSRPADLVLSSVRDGAALGFAETMEMASASCRNG